MVDSETTFFVVDFEVVPDVVVSVFEVVIAFDVLVVSAVVTAFVVVVVSDVVTVLEAVSAAVVEVWLTAEVTAVGSSFTVFSVVPQAVSMVDNMMISIAFFIAISSFQQHHTTYAEPLSSLFGKLLLFGLFTQLTLWHEYQSRILE